MAPVQIHLFHSPDLQQFRYAPGFIQVQLFVKNVVIFVSGTFEFDDGLRWLGKVQFAQAQDTGQWRSGN